MKKTIDIDTIIILILPLILIVFLIIKDSEIMLFGSILTVAIFLYEIIIFRYRRIYGFAGIKILSMPSILFLSFTIFIAIPSVYICSNVDNIIKYTFFSSIILFYLLFPLGLLTGNILFKVDVERIKQFYKCSFIKSKYDNFIYELLILLLSFSFLIFIVYLLRVKIIPLFEMFKNPGSYLNLVMLREESLKLLSKTFIESYLFAWLRDIFLPFGILGSLFLFIQYNKKKYFRLFLTFLIFGILNNSLTLAKGPTAGIILAISAFFFFRKKTISLKFVIISIILIFSFPYLVYHFISPPAVRDPINLINSIFNRVFLTPSDTLYHYFEIFPSTHEFLLGRSSHLFSWIHSKGFFPISNYVARVWWENPATTGFANTNYLGNFWADFGWFGIIGSSFFIGFFVHLLYQKLLYVSNYTQNIIYVTISSITVMTFSFTFISSNFTTLLLTRGLILIFIFLYLCKYEQLNTKCNGE